MKKFVLTVVLVLLATAFGSVEAYEFGNDWPFGSCSTCPKRKQIFKHLGHDTSRNKVGQKVYFRRSGVVKSIHKDRKGWGYIVVFESDWTSFNIIHLSDVAVKIGQYYKVKDNRGIYVGRIADLTAKGVAPHIHVSQASTPFDPKKESWYWVGALPQCDCQGLPAFPWKYVSPDPDLVRIFDN